MNLCVPVLIQIHRVTLYYIENRALLSYDPSLYEKRRVHGTISNYNSGILEHLIYPTKRKSVDDISETLSKRTRKHRNIPSNNDSEREYNC